MKNKLLNSLLITGLVTTQINAIDIIVNFIDIGEGGVNNSGLSASQQAIFESAEATWEKHLIGYLEAGPTSLVIDASAPAIDGEGGILGQAGPRSFQNSTNFIYSDTGIMQFDSADLSSMETRGTLEAVILHEMGHVLGSGTLWEDTGLYVPGSFQYTGAAALARYQRDFDPSATFIPVESGGGSGTAESHWDEDDSNPNANNPDAPYNGQSFNAELMTGFLSGTDTYLSDVTLGSFEDLGYRVAYIITPELYWDAGNPTNDGAITSGDGVWDATTTNFSDKDGNVNEPYNNSAKLFFTDSGANINVIGTFSPLQMTFTVDGYNLSGGTFNSDDNYLITVERSTDTATFSSDFTGTGIITLDGSGTLNLTGNVANPLAINAGKLVANSTAVLSGNLDVGVGGKLETDAGGFGSSININNSGEILMNGDNTIAEYTSTGSLSGTGALTANSFALNGGSDVAVNLLSGDVTTNGAVSISGSIGEQLIIQTGTTTLNGNNLLNALKSIDNSGTLILNGSQSASSYLGKNGTIGGNGVLTTMSFEAGSVQTAAALGQTLTFSADVQGGNVTLGAGSNLQFDSSIGVGIFDVFPLFTNSTIVGDATSIGFETFDVSKLGNGVKAVFDVQTGNIIVTSSLDNGGTASASTIANNLLGGAVGSQRMANISGVDPAAQAIFNNITSLSGLKELSPEVYSSVADYSLRQHLNLVKSARYSPYTVTADTWEFFAGVTTNSIESEGSLNNADYELNGNGGYVGVSNRFREHSRFGIFGAYDAGDIKGDLLELDSKGSVVGAFLEFDAPMPWENDRKYGIFTIGVSAGKFEFDGTRRAQGFVNNVDSIDTTTLEFELGYKASLIDSETFKLTPFLGTNYINADVDGFQETGTINSLRVSDYSKNLFLWNVGVDAQWRPTAGAFGFTGSLTLSGNLGDDQTTHQAAFDGITPFEVTALGISGNTLESRVGAFFYVTPQARVDLSYFNLSGDEIASADGGNVGLTLSW